MKKERKKLCFGTLKSMHCRREKNQLYHGKTSVHTENIIYE